MKSILLFGLCFTLSLVLVFGSVNSPYSFTLSAFASDEGHTTEDSGGNHGGDNQGGDTGDQGNDHGDGSHGMPPPEDAPAATAGGGGSDDDDDEADNDNNDNDDDNDNDNPQIPNDAPPTPDAPTAKKIECQEVPLFSTSCGPAGADSTQGATSAATVCPTSPTPTSYDILNGLSVTNAVWGHNNNDFELKTKQQDSPETVFLHRTATPIQPGLNAGHAFKDPATRAVCTGEPVTVANPDGSNDVYGSDGSRTNILVDKDTGNSKVTKYTAGGKTTVESKVEHLTGETVRTVTDEDKSGRITATEYDSATGNPTRILKYDPISRVSKVDSYDPVTKTLTEQKVDDPNSGTRLVTTFVPGSNKPETAELIDVESELPIIEIKYKEDGVTPAKIIDFTEGGNTQPQ